MIASKTKPSLVVEIVDKTAMEECEHLESQVQIENFVVSLSPAISVELSTSSAGVPLSAADLPSIASTVELDAMPDYAAADVALDTPNHVAVDMQPARDEAVDEAEDDESEDSLALPSTMNAPDTKELN